MLNFLFNYFCIVIPVTGFLFGLVILADKICYRRHYFYSEARAYKGIYYLRLEKEIKLNKKRS